MTFSLRILIISAILISFSSTVNSQSLKKAFKAFHNKNYSEAENIFYTVEHRNTCAGIFGQALVLQHKPIKYKEGDSEESKKITEFNTKLSAYSKVMKAEKLFKTLPDKDLKSIKDYVTSEEISGMIKELETYFLNSDPEILSYYRLSQLEELNKGSKFIIKMQNKYVDMRFEEIKQKKSLYDAEKLVKHYADNDNIGKVQRYIDSLRFDKAKTAYYLSELLYKYPDNHFKADIIKKIKKINKDFQTKISKEKDDQKTIVVLIEAETEEEAFNTLTNIYYTNCKERKDYKYSFYKKHTASDFYYMKLSDKQMNDFHLDKKYLIYEYKPSVKYNKVLQAQERYQPHYPGCYALDLHNGFKLFSRDKVYKKGKLLDEYTAIFIKRNGKYRSSSNEVYQTLEGIIDELKSKSKHQVLTGAHWDGLKIYPKDNPFYFYYKVDKLPEHDQKKDAVYVFFISSYKNTLLFEIYPDKMDEALERIMYKIGFYFR